MKAIILAAGEGKRMRPLTLYNPKPLLKVAGRPIIEYVLDAFPDEITEVIVIIKYLGYKIKKHLGNKFKNKTVTYVEGSNQGNAYSFLAAKKHFESQERFILIYGDEIPRRQNVLACLRYPNSVCVFKSHHPQVHGIISLTSKGAINEIIEKPQHPPSPLAVDGIMVLNTAIFSYTPLPDNNGEYYFTSLLNQFVKDFTVWPVTAKNFIGDLTTPADLIRIGKLL